MFVFLTPFAYDAIDREAYVPRYIDEASSSPPVRPMSVSEGRRSQSSSHVPIRPDQLREMIGDVVRESLQQAGVGNVPEPANINPPQYSAYQFPAQPQFQPQYQPQFQSQFQFQPQPEYQRQYYPQPQPQYYSVPQAAREAYPFQPQPVREGYQYPAEYREHSQATSTETVGTSSSGRLHPIYHLPGPYQPMKFSGSKDPAVAEEWIESVESVMGLFTLSEREKVRFTMFHLRGDAKVW